MTMRKVLLAFVVGLGLVAGACGSDPSSSGSGGCCKHCGTSSLACVDSCIALGLACHAGTGCACQ